MTLAFRSFRARLLVLFGGLSLVILALVLFTARQSNQTIASNHLRQVLSLSHQTFSSIIEERKQALLELGQILSKDYAFKVAIVSSERETQTSAIENLLNRLQHASFITLLDAEGSPLAQLDYRQTPIKLNPGELAQLLEIANANEFGEGSEFFLQQTSLVQVIIIPLLAPDLIGWLTIGYELNSQFLNEIKPKTQTDIILFQQSSQIIASSTLAVDRAPDLFASRERIALNGKTFATQSYPLNQQGDLQALLLRDTEATQAPFKKMEQDLAGLVLLALVMSLLLSRLIAQKTTTPLKDLSLAAQAIEKGDYQSRVSTDHIDELGQLASSFNQMAAGLQEKEKVQNLLGKVVSPAVADELLKKDLVLGGEERDVSVLFSDLRNFTRFSEYYQPQALLSFLNQYLNQMTQCIDAEQGIVDKFIGDAIMAIFGAPLSLEDHSQKAVMAALNMQAALKIFNQTQGYPTQLSLGIGINSDRVVAGNMGASHRLNYTVIGDGVNLASRLESLTKFYGLEILVAESTQNQTQGISYWLVDCVQVKGKQQAVNIYSPIGITASLSPKQLDLIEAWSQIVSDYRRQNFVRAQSNLANLADDFPQTLGQIYRLRLEQALELKDLSAWSHVYQALQK